MRWWVSLTDWNKIREEFETTDISMKDLAEKYDVKYATLRSRKSREQWGKDDATQQEMQRNKKERVATEKIVEQLNENSDLTEKEKQFTVLYLQYFNATKAYFETYDCTYNTARTEGSRLLAKPSVKKELDRLKRAQRTELYVNSLDIKKEWLKQAFADITDYVEFGTEEVTVFDENDAPVFSEDGEPMTVKRSAVYFKDPDEVDGSLIQEVKMGRDGPVIKLYDKQKAMDRVMEFLKESGSGTSDLIVIQDDWADEDE